MDYSTRRVTNVAVWGLERHEHEQETTVSGTVKVQISSIDGDEYGPNATLELAVPLLDGATIQDAERGLLAGASALLGHLSKLSENDLRASLHESQPKQLLKKSG